MLWGLVGLLQKLGTNRISARSLMVWLTVGFLVLLPWFFQTCRLDSLRSGTLVLGLAGGLTNGLGAWCLFASLEQGAKASIAVPLTALYPINTLDPEAVIVGGGLGSVEGLYWQSFVKATRTHIWVESHRDLPIPHAALGTQAGLIGAAANLWKKVAPGASG